jgi:hypothetical protein
MIKPQLALALGFTRQVGKDTLCERLCQLDSRFRRFAFADALRRELAPFLQQQFGIDIWTCMPEQKEFCRPYLILHGMTRRSQDPDYWVKKTLDEIEEALAREPDICPIAVDARFSNEIHILRRDLGARIIHVTRDGAPEPTGEEQKHYAGLIPLADVHFHWGGDTELGQRAYAEKLLLDLAIGSVAA